LALLVVVALAACSSYSSTTSAPSDAGADVAAPPPPPSPEDAGDDAADAGETNLLINGGFEEGCAAWGTNSPLGTAQADTTARSGTGSCRLCYAGGADASAGANANLAQTVAFALHAPAHPFGTLWVRAPPSGPTPVNVYARVTVGQDDGGLLDCLSAGHVPLGDTWQRIDPTCTDALDGTSLTLDVVADDGCVLVDDATLVVK
jgi:hypothetical protein